MKKILNMLKNGLLENIKGSNDGSRKISAYNDHCTPVIHPDATNAMIGTLLCGAMSAISLLVFYFCN